LHEKGGIIMADRKKEEVSGRWIQGYGINTADLVDETYPADQPVKNVFDTSKSDTFFNQQNLQSGNVPTFVYKQ
jgi:hypothetical protein